MGQGFNLTINRDLFLISDDPNIAAAVKKIIEPFPNIVIADSRILGKPRNELYFVVGGLDFNETESLQKTAGSFNKIADPQARKIIYVSAPAKISREQIFFCAELGSRYNAYGVNKDRELRSYIKKVAIQAEQIGSVTHFENEVSRLVRKGDGAGLRALDERLSEMDRNVEDVLRLRAVVNQRLSRHKKVEYCLKEILKINPESLWAAYQLGTHYLRMRKPGQGIAILEKLSRFNDLNFDRLSDLGEAYLNSGQTDKAETVMKKGQKASGGNDERFDEGLAKVQLMRGDVKGAMSLLKSNTLNESVVSYLNMRAVLSMKTNKFDTGFDLYKLALSKSVSDEVILAKLNFNMGLGCIKAKKTEEALKYFEKSVALGGDKFSKAERPLEITRKVLKVGKNDKKSLVDDESFEFEEFSSKNIEDDLANVPPNGKATKAS